MEETFTFSHFRFSETSLYVKLLLRTLNNISSIRKSNSVWCSSTFCIIFIFIWKFDCSTFIWQQDLVEDTFTFSHFYFSETFCIIFIFIWLLRLQQNIYPREAEGNPILCDTLFKVVKRNRLLHKQFRNKRSKEIVWCFHSAPRILFFNNFYCALFYAGHSFWNCPSRNFRNSYLLWKGEMKQNISDDDAMTKVFWSNSSGL